MKKHVLVSLPASFSTARIGENLGIRYIKPFLHSKGYNIDILEFQFSNSNIIDFCNLINNYDIIGFSINYCKQIEVLKKILHNCHFYNKNKLIYCGGHFATIAFKELLTNFEFLEFVMLSDGELSTLELIENNYNYTNIHNISYIKNNSEIISNEIIIENNLDQLPFPYRDTNSYYLGDKHFSIITGRGCYNNCSYCSVGAYTNKYYYNKIRFRSAKNIFDEIVYLYNTYGIIYFTFQDDLFIGTDKRSRDRAVELANLIIDSKIKIFYSIQCCVKSIDEKIFNLLFKSGLRNVMIGIENFSNHALKCYNKQQNKNDIINSINILKKIGIPISFGFIMFYPEMRVSEILENIEFLHKLNLINIRSITSVLTIYKGTNYEFHECSNIEINKRTFYIEYSFKDKRINEYIDTCKLFSKEYGKIENKLKHLEFKSHSNTRIDLSIINKYMDEFKDYLYEFAKSKYYEIFENIKYIEYEYLKNSLKQLNDEISIFL